MEQEQTHQQTRILEARILPKAFNTDEQKDSFFVELFRRCKETHTYSAKETIQAMGIKYERVEAWAEEQNGWKAYLELCRSICADRAETDGLCFKIPTAMTFKYMLEGDDEFAALYPTSEEQEQLLREAEEGDRKEQKDLK